MKQKFETPGAADELEKTEKGSDVVQQNTQNKLIGELDGGDEEKTVQELIDIQGYKETLHYLKEIDVIDEKFKNLLEKYQDHNGYQLQIDGKRKNGSRSVKLQLNKGGKEYTVRKEALKYEGSYYLFVGEKTENGGKDVGLFDLEKDEFVEITDYKEDKKIDNLHVSVGHPDQLRTGEDIYIPALLMQRQENGLPDDMGTIGYISLKDGTYVDQDLGDLSTKVKIVFDDMMKNIKDKLK